MNYKLLTSLEVEPADFSSALSAADLLAISEVSEDAALPDSPVQYEFCKFIIKTYDNI